MAGFRKAKAEQAAIKMGFYGMAGSGKTFTALLCAEGLAKVTKKRIAFVDTEHGSDFYAQTVKERQLHPQAFDFDALYTRSITEILAAVKGLDPNTYGVVVLDSMTHIWEAAMNAYSGKLTKIGTIPVTQWGKIKKPYKELLNYLLSSTMHLLICGRQGNVWEKNEDTEELENVGTKMKAEGETPYEPHILIHMEAVRDKSGTATITAFVEKDRTGLLAGKVIACPNFDTLIKPVLPYLGITQAAVQSEEETSAQDAESLTESDLARINESSNILKEYNAKLELCQGAAEFKALAAEITPALKKRMTTEDVATLREKYLETEKRFK